MSALRFCMLTTFYPPAGFGGDAIQVRRLAHALADRGHEVTVVRSAEGYATMARPRVAQPDEDHPGVRVIAVDAGLGRISPLATYLTGRPLLVRRRLERVLEERFDVLHFHNPSLLGGPGALSLGSAVKLYTLHEQWLVCPTHVLWKNRREVCVEPHCVRCQLVHHRPPQPWRVTRLVERSVAELDALIAPSRTSARLHARFAACAPIEHLPHFVPEPAPGPPHEHHRPYFLYVGRLEAIKGVGTAIAAAAGRAEDLLIVGTGSMEHRLRRQAEGLANVHFLGWRSGAALSALYRGAIAVVVPTLGHEAFGLVAVEAFAHGTPAILPRFGALGELVEDGGGALSYGDDDELSAALDQLAADPALRRRLAERAREAVGERWTEARHLDRYFELIARAGHRRGDERLAAAATAARGEEVVTG
jgi:glycosyltransferase involved in cell wall biosynthesis